MISRTRRAYSATHASSQHSCERPSAAARIGKPSMAPIETTVVRGAAARPASRAIGRSWLPLLIAMPGRTSPIDRRRVAELVGEEAVDALHRRVAGREHGRRRGAAAAAHADRDDAAHAMAAHAQLDAPAPARRGAEAARRGTRGGGERRRRGRPRRPRGGATHSCASIPPMPQRSTIRMRAGVRARRGAARRARSGARTSACARSRCRGAACRRGAARSRRSGASAGRSARPWRRRTTVTSDVPTTAGSRRGAARAADALVVRDRAPCA